MDARNVGDLFRRATSLAMDAEFHIARGRIATPVLEQMLAAVVQRCTEVQQRIQEHCSADHRGQQVRTGSTLELCRPCREHWQRANDLAREATLELGL